MKYPIIHSLSTVGILKHYNQDYLIHGQRTDFTGANGVGKSIVADLLQLIFINEKQYIQFGTEGYKKEDRLTTKLAYKCRDAYAFLLIQLATDKFICIGVCIPNATNRPIKPFIITNSPNKELPLLERAFTTAQKPFARDFISNSKICVVDELGKHFRDTHGLFFESYSTREQKDEHYARLFDQHIMPINLSNTSSLKAFAKIIQSFSRARSAGDKAEELKEFLFDGLEKDFENSFESHKSEIDRLLTDYDILQAFINDLEKKQRELEGLNRLANVQLDSKKKFLAANCGYHYTHSNMLNLRFNAKIEELDMAVSRAEKLANRLPRLEILALHYKTMQETGKKKLEDIRKCLDLSKKISLLELRIRSLTFKDASAVTEDIAIEQHLQQYDDKEIIRRSTRFLPIYLKYGSISGIERKLEEQKESLRLRIELLNGEVQFLKSVNRLLVGSSEDSLIAKILHSDREISTAQEAVLFHLLDTHWERPDNNNFSYYTDNFNFLNEQHITEDARLQGYWLCLNHLNIYIPALSREPILQNPDLRKKAIAELVKNNLTTIERAELELNEINKFGKGLSFNIEPAEILRDLDPDLHDYGVFTDLKISCQLVLQLDGLIQVLLAEKERLSSEKIQLIAAAVIPIESDLDSLRSLEESNQICWETRAKKYGNDFISDTATEKSLREDTLPSLKQQLTESEALAESALKAYTEYYNAFKEEYPELEKQARQELNEDTLREIKNAYDNAVRNYQSDYKAACKLFLETANENNPEIAAEVAEERFSFPLLEKALLGTKIRFYDQIGEELQTANLSRYKLIDSIYETMLKIFLKTKKKYDEYNAQIRDLNLFFKGRTISNKYYFQVKFEPSKDIPIEWITTLQGKSQQLHKPGELALGDSVESFIEDFFRRASNYRKKITFRDLLDPKTYFTLDAGLTDEHGVDTSGSTGETYSAKVLLGIGRLSKFQSENRPGIRFIILEETANLDKTNFNNFPAIAEEFGYQIITMTPKPFGADASSGWYLHHLLAGKNDTNINYPVPASYFKTNTTRKNLETYLKQQ